MDMVRGHYIRQDGNVEPPDRLEQVLAVHVAVLDKSEQVPTLVASMGDMVAGIIAPVTTTARHTRLLILNHDSGQYFIAVKNHNRIYYIYNHRTASMLHRQLTYLTPIPRYKTKRTLGRFFLAGKINLRGTY
jgi:uncharacterized protein (DUF1786 family)